MERQPAGRELPDESGAVAAGLPCRQRGRPNVAEANPRPLLNEPFLGGERSDRAGALKQARPGDPLGGVGMPLAPERLLDGDGVLRVDRREPEFELQTARHLLATRIVEAEIDDAAVRADQ